MDLSAREGAEMHLNLDVNKVNKSSYWWNNCSRR
jgi:hypothetical protein